MKKFVVTLLLSLMVALMSGTLHKAVAKAATPRLSSQAPVVKSLATMASSRNILPTVGFGPGPMPCPPACGGLKAN